MFAPPIKAPRAKSASQAAPTHAPKPPQHVAVPRWPAGSLSKTPPFAPARLSRSEAPSLLSSDADIASLAGEVPLGTKPPQHRLVQPGVDIAEETGKSETSEAALDTAPEVLRSPGQPLAKDMQSYFSERFLHDFSSVRIHADAPAAATVRALHANAYTVGAHIAFAPGLYQPWKPAGMRLLAHELAHVVQQRGGGAPPGPGQEQDAEAAAKAVEVGAEPKVRAPSQVGIAAQSEQPAVAEVKSTPYEQLMWFYRFYLERLGYEYKGTGANKGRLINPNGGHFVDLSFDAQSPKMVSVIVASKSFEASEYNFTTERFETRSRYIEMVEVERKLSVPERIGIGFSSTAKIVGGAALCAFGTAETVGAGAVVACAYGADLAASGIRELRGEESRTLTNQAVTAGLSQVLDEETAQQVTDDAEAAVNIMLGAYGAAKLPKAPVAEPRPPAPDVVVPKGAITEAVPPKPAKPTTPAKATMPPAVLSPERILVHELNPRVAVFDKNGTLIVHKNAASMGHQAMIDQNKTLNGKLPEGGRAVTIIKEGVEPLAIDSAGIHGRALPSPQWVQDAVKRHFR